MKQAAPKQVRFTGAQPHGSALEILKRSAFSVFPSICFEGFPLTVMEAMAFGIPTVASNLDPTLSGTALPASFLKT